MPEESDRIKIRKRSLIFAKNQLDLEKRPSPFKNKFLETIKTRCSSTIEDNPSMTTKIVF